MNPGRARLKLKRKSSGKAIDALTCEKAPSEDSIPLEVSIKSTLLKPLHSLLFFCWREGKVPQDMTMPILLPYIKTRKCTHSECNSYWSIFLLKKVFAQMVLTWLQVITDCIYDLGLRNPLLTWSLYIKSKRNLVNSRCHYTHLHWSLKGIWPY